MDRLFARFTRQPRARVAPQLLGLPIIGYIEGIPVRSEVVDRLPSGRFENILQASNDLNILHNLWMEYSFLEDDPDERYQTQPLVIQRIVRLLHRRHEILRAEIMSRRRQPRNKVEPSTPRPPPPPSGGDFSLVA